ncbi:type IX secretion system periplasmic lipoprotein PorW/SprE [Pontibacter cellulosilyticus]|uniref:Tetratricopeptide repeat protein n=1 Tax=Pontibacter cellulosilyticus TaxID=1720253 RepID=A0A923N803_9BACT|nr:tetratricopeptide repeat protein [Pontibacter cellulosilyticus]MBC5993891.1 tetratricopeptide repeat protein [Pontibacter cellulosilyticus]
MNKHHLYLYFLVVGLLLSACSVERKNPLSKTYHNTTARYNGYFLAKEKMDAIERGLVESMQFDYNQVLPIYPSIDSTTAKTLAPELEDVIKKASFPIQYHKNSKWIDNCYILIGQANYYQLNFGEASRTFKYVNATSKNAEDRHKALVWLMRTFLQTDELDNAQQVSEYLRKERLNKDNARELYLARAQYHRILGDTAEVIKNLAYSIPNFEDKDEQSRIRFTLAQLYQLTGQDKDAYKQYAKILRRNPPYDVGFFSRLYLGQVSELEDKQDKERIANYYKKLLKDDKNTEYRDKIYYEMAQFELRQQNYDKALAYLEQSLRTSGTLKNQKAYSYVSAGEVYFDNLSKYNLAAAYYDSATQAYPRVAPEYEAVAERRDILADFAKQFTTIQTQDSLQRLARLSETERTDYLQQLIQRQEEQRLQDSARQVAATQTNDQQGNVRNRRNNSNQQDNTMVGGIWYFDNPAALASARSEFVRRWGDRPLQDFWRIRARGESGTTNQAEIARAPVTSPEQQMTIEERAQMQMQQYLKDIPLSTADMMRSEKEVEDAYFKLGNIYSQKLRNPVKATETFEEFIKRFPNSEHTAEVYYNLYLLYGKADNKDQQQVYYSKIKQQYPNTTYARLVDDADFMSKNALDNIKAHALYDSAYTFYENYEFAKATNIINQLVSQYPLNDIKDKTAYLEAMITARTKKPEELYAQLNSFKKTYPNSALIPQANQLLATYQSLEQRNELRKDAPNATPPKQKTADALTPEEKVSTEIASTVTASVAKPTPQAPPVAAKPEPAKADTTALPTTPEPKQTAPVKTDQPAKTVTAPSDSVDLPKPTAPPVDPMAYEAATDSAFYMVLIYPSDAPAFKDILPKYEKYNSTYFKNQQLSIDSAAFSPGKTMLVMRSFPDVKQAQGYTIKQKAPQSPIGRIRGVEFVTFAISSANYQKFLQKKDIDTYLTFFKNNY